MKNNKLAIVFGTMFLLAIGLVAAQSGNYRYGMMGNSGQLYQINSANGGYGHVGMMSAMWGYGGYGRGLIFISWLTYLLVLALIVSAIYWLIKSANSKK